MTLYYNWMIFLHFNF